MDTARVVAAAVVRDGRVLAARRSVPPELAGRWEFPGGKVEAGETDAEALTRECHEELGVAIRIGALLAVADIAPGPPLYVYLAELLDGEPSAREHDRLRWLAPDELDSVEWLPADRPAVDALRSRS
ncbi:MAG: mismatch repair protein MutT [Pseudonocardiales bacterium]|nr:mismatch repair protein MutT [Pseudonocardiales bacterium]